MLHSPCSQRKDDELGEMGRMTGEKIQVLAAATFLILSMAGTQGEEQGQRATEEIICRPWSDDRVDPWGWTVGSHNMEDLPSGGEECI